MLAGALACAPPPALEPVGREPDLRVGLVVGAGGVRVAGEGAVAGVERGRAVLQLAAGAEVRLVPEGRGVRAVGPAGESRHEALTFVSLASGRFVLVDGRPYRGAVEVVVARAGLTVVNDVPLEAYLAGVVTAEMGRRSAAERAALHAQAIVSRTYALANRGKFGAEGYDVRGTVADQAYGGVAAETPEGRDAVRATAGQVVTYRGELITPFFHSTCGSSTAAVEEAFRSARAAPYLRPVSDRRPGGGHYCDRSPRFRWTVAWDGAALRDILRRTVPSVLGVDGAAVDELRDVRVRRTGPSGRVRELRIAVGAGEIPVFGPDVRAVLEAPDGRPLGSTALVLEVERAGGAVRRVAAQGAGWGHGLGLCQWGAVGRARAGQDARTILTTYFPGTRIARWY